MLRTKLSSFIGASGIRMPNQAMVGRLSQQSFEIIMKKLFANGEQGFFYDPNDLSTMFQDAAGTVPVTGAGQPVGLILDKSKPVTNTPILDSAFLLADGWIKSNPEISVTNVDGSLRVSKGASEFKGVYKPFSCESNKLYRLSVKYKNHTGNNVRFHLRSASSTGGNLALAQTIQTGTATDGEGTTFFISNADTHSVVIDSQNAAESSVEVESIVITKVSDSINHAYQTVSASRPTLSSRVNMLTGTDTLANWSFVYTKKNGNAVKATGASPLNHICHKTFTYVPSSTITYYVEVTKGVGFCFFQLCYSNTNRAKCTINLATGENFVKKLLTNTTTVVVEDGGDVWRLTLTGSASYTSGSAYANMGFATSLKDDTYNSYDEPIFLATGSEIMTIKAIDVRETRIGSNLPKYQRVTSSTDYDSVGFPNYLVFDGVDDFLQTGNIDFTATDKVSLFVGVRKLSDAAVGIVVELSGNTNTNNGSFFLAAPRSIIQNVGFIARGSAQTAADFNDVAAPYSTVVTAKMSISDDFTQLRERGRVAASNTDLGTGNLGNHPLYIGRRNGTALPFNGHIYSLIGVSRLTTDSETASIEKELAKRTGVTLNV